MRAVIAATRTEAQTLETEAAEFRLRYVAGEEENEV